MESSLKESVRWAGRLIINIPLLILFASIVVSLSIIDYVFWGTYETPRS